MMGSTEKFCLRWNDFESNISVAFREIREEKDFFDCTLSCGSKQIQAHKLILSACSPFFRTVLKQNHHQHPLLYLKGVEFSDLQAVLNFMYHGEVNVAQEELNSFLSVAEELQVKGLTQNDSTSNSNSKHETAPSSLPKPRPRPSQREPERHQVPKSTRLPPPPPVNVQAPYHPPRSDDIQEIPMAIVKTEPQSVHLPPNTPAVTGGSGGLVDAIGMEVASLEDSYAEGYDDYGGYDGQGYAGQYVGEGGVEHQGVSNYVQKKESGFDCGMCGKEFSDQSNCRRHVKEKHFGADQERCPVCYKAISKRNLPRHIKICSEKINVS